MRKREAETTRNAAEVSPTVDHPSPQAQQQALEFMRAMLGQLRRMASAQRLDMLAYLLEMALVEAGDALGKTDMGTKGGKGSAERLRQDK